MEENLEAGVVVCSTASLKASHHPGPGGGGAQAAPPSAALLVTWPAARCGPSVHPRRVYAYDVDDIQKVVPERRGPCGSSGPGRALVAEEVARFLRQRAAEQVPVLTRSG
jgi:hypothetical protein